MSADLGGGSADLGGPVQIGAREIYDQVVLVGRVVDRLDSKLGGHADKLGSHEDRLGDHETRIRAIELRRTFTPAQLVSTLLAAAVVVVSTIALFLG